MLHGGVRAGVKQKKQLRADESIENGGKDIDEEVPR